jgi:hypothetical protein
LATSLQAQRAPGQADAILNIVCGFLCFLMLASNVWSMSRWNEARGVYDDVPSSRRIIRFLSQCFRCGVCCSHRSRAEAVDDDLLEQTVKA